MDNRKVVLITGCSSGFGLSTAVRLAASGHFVWATMRDTSKRFRLENGLAKHRAQAFIRALDVTQPLTIQNVVDEIDQTHGRIDVLVNNAGYLVAGFFEDLKPEEIRAQMETNFFGAQNVCRGVLPLMRRQKKGRIINISSIAGQIGTPTLGAYNASKWALEGFSESLYFELKPFGISVSLLEPGLYTTELFSKNIRYAQDFDNPQSPYFSLNRKIKAYSHKFHKLGKDPNRIAGLIERIINERSPRLRYVSDFPSWVRINAQKILPPAWVAYILRRVFHADK
ncbi:MAG: SDR family oxidoreductase [Candidatus Omnitrophica bacterium]|nr:SDR family oxidoreductase [Candidatus Omnitrophota bacterium]